MEIKEAIQHCREVAAGYTEQGKCPECAADHEQLAEWLTVLKQIAEIFNCDPGDPEQLKRLCDKLRGWQQAEQDGRLKAGDTVYQTDGVRVYKCKVKRIIFETDGVSFDARAIGVRVFLTPEEAKAAARKEES